MDGGEAGSLHATQWTNLRLLIAAVRREVLRTPLPRQELIYAPKGTGHGTQNSFFVPQY